MEFLFNGCMYNQKGVLLVLKKTIFILSIITVSISILGFTIKNNEEKLNQTEEQTNKDYNLNITWVNTDKTNFIARHEQTGNDNRYVVEYMEDGLTYPLVINKETGEVIKTKKYDGIYDFTEGMAAVYYADRELFNGGGYTIDNYRCGFIDTDGNEVIATIYDRAYPFSDGLAEVEKEGKFGYIDHDGKLVLPLEYDFVQPFRKGYAAVKKTDDNGNEVWGIIDKKGCFKALEGVAGISAFNNGIARAWRNNAEIFINTDGNEVNTLNTKPEILNKYDVVRNFVEGRAVVAKSVYPEWQTKYGVIDEVGNEIIPMEFSYISDYCEGMTSVNLNRGKNAYFDINGNKVTPFKYDVTQNFHELCSVVGIGNYKEGSLVLGVINKYGNEIVPLIFNHISNIYDGYALIGYENGDNQYVKTSKKIGILKLPENYDLDNGTTKFISVLINDKKVYFDQDPIIHSNRVLVPIRAVMESMGANVAWDENNYVTVTKGDRKIELTIGETEALLNGEIVYLDVPAEIISGRTLVPVRFIAQCLNYNVEWNPDTQTVSITE